MEKHFPQQYPKNPMSELLENNADPAMKELNRLFDELGLRPNQKVWIEWAPAIFIEASVLMVNEDYTVTLISPLKLAIKVRKEQIRLHKPCTNLSSGSVDVMEDFNFG